MILLDANVLIYAFRRDSPYHQNCHAWLGRALSGRRKVATTSVVELALVRIMTHPGIGEARAPAAEVFRFLSALKAQPLLTTIEPGTRHLALFAELCENLGLGGNDVNDAFLAALALESGATLATVDRGFRRFPGLQVLDPLA